MVSSTNDEIERLRAELHRVAESRRGQRERAERAEAENERRKQAFNDMFEDCTKANTALHAEIERLRAGWDEAQTFMQLALEREERLRAALTEITELELEGDASLDDALTIADEALNPPPA